MYELAASSGQLPDTMCVEGKGLMPLVILADNICSIYQLACLAVPSLSF